MAIRMHCPHCREVSVARSSNVLTRTSRDLFYVCNNTLCGHTFRAVLEVNCTISPSAMPDPGVIIPLSRHVRRDLIGEQMQRQPASDYQPDNGGQTADMFDGSGPPPDPTPPD